VVIVGGDVGLIDRARQRIAGLERCWSRFLPDSEISSLNRAEGAPVHVSECTRLLIERSIQGWVATEGLFDPTVLSAMVAAGYDRSFPLLDQPTTPGGHAMDTAPAPGAGAIDVDPVAGTVTMPSGWGFDPGGMGKGLAADLVVEELLELGAAGVCINLGGDVRVDGQAPTADGWQIALEDPGTPEKELARVALVSGAVATSTAQVRSWTSEGRRHHHLMDPRTGAPTATSIVQVSIVAGAGWWAEALTKAVYIGGPSAVVELLASTSATGLVLMDDGTSTAFPGFWEMACT
jgi:thiamine biosynthesis lipoprotein